MISPRPDKIVARAATRATMMRFMIMLSEKELTAYYAFRRNSQEVFFIHRPNCHRKDNSCAGHFPRVGAVSPRGNSSDFASAGGRAQTPAQGPQETDCLHRPRRGRARRGDVLGVAEERSGRQRADGKGRAPQHHG